MVFGEDLLPFLVHEIVTIRFFWCKSDSPAGPVGGVEKSRSWGSTAGPAARATAFSITFWSSRTFPGQEQFISLVIAAGEKFEGIAQGPEAAGCALRPHCDCARPLHDCAGRRSEYLCGWELFLAGQGLSPGLSQVTTGLR